MSSGSTGDERRPRQRKLAGPFFVGPDLRARLRDVDGLPTGAFERAVEGDVVDRELVRADPTGKTAVPLATTGPMGTSHEAYLHLMDADVSWHDRAHFFAIAARMMRRLLVDHARARRRLRRGGGAVRVDVTSLQLPAPAAGADLVDLDDALARLAAQNERQAQAVELHFFGGLTYAQDVGARGIGWRGSRRSTLPFDARCCTRAIGQNAPCAFRIIMP